MQLSVTQNLKQRPKLYPGESEFCCFSFFLHTRTHARAHTRHRPETLLCPHDVNIVTHLCPHNNLSPQDWKQASPPQWIPPCHPERCFAGLHDWKCSGEKTKASRCKAKLQSDRLTRCHAPIGWGARAHSRSPMFPMPSKHPFLDFYWTLKPEFQDWESDDVPPAPCWSWLRATQVNSRSVAAVNISKPELSLLFITSEGSAGRTQS